MEAEYRLRKASWRAGDRSRENSLHLLYLSWMHWADPLFVTGFEDDPEAARLWIEAFNHFGGEHSEDAEFLHVAALMADLFPWALGDEVEWEARAERMRVRAIGLAPEGFAPDRFEGRGEYGMYFAHHARASEDRSAAPQSFLARLKSGWARYSTLLRLGWR
ncbi:MAG TPA: hypothetical protein VGR32_04445 [Brevundimonas sp.]|jgi:hypothetical protein|uniref:hypothetical protein n=1 Tax=Brevundimonas sp. TaxID=1871086 RepID=UPI002DED5DF5|nr:hypothetical protein [Brevundimonas sp.]